MGVLSGLFSIVLVLALPIGIIVGIVKLVRRGRGPEATLAAQAGPGSSPTVPVVWDRFFLYILSFAGLMAALFAAYSVMAVVLGLVVQHVSTLGTLISTSDAKTQIAGDIAGLRTLRLAGAGSWSRGHRARPGCICHRRLQSRLFRHRDRRCDPSSRHGAARHARGLLSPGCDERDVDRVGRNRGLVHRRR